MVAKVESRGCYLGPCVASAMLYLMHSSDNNKGIVRSLEKNGTIPESCKASNSCTNRVALHTCLGSITSEDTIPYHEGHIAYAGAF